MSFDAQKLCSLLPAIYRIRDIERARGSTGLLSAAEASELATLEAEPALSTDEQQRLAELLDKRDRGPLRSLLAVLAEQIATVEESLEQLYDDQFIETCAEWAVSYIGDLIGYRALHPVTPKVTSLRAEVAHTIAFRRRKGTASMLEQLARDVTGWNARAVEFFQVLATTQYMNHVRPFNPYAPDPRRWEPLERIGTAFDSIPHTVDARRIESGRGRYNIPNVGLFLWRLDAYSLTRSPAVRVDDRRHRIGPLGNDAPLFNRPETEDEITHLAERVNVPQQLSRRELHAHLATYYGAARSLALFVNGDEIPAAQVLICDLSDDGDSWACLRTVGTRSIQCWDE